MTTRRDFITAAATLALAPEPLAAAPGEPWYRRTCRWGQTNITEKDPVRYDIPWWREFWKRTQVQGVIINAGGIVAYYPEQISAAASRGVSGRPRSVRRTGESRARRRSDRRRAHGFQPHRRRLFSRRIPIGSRATATAIRTAPLTNTSPASTALITTSICPPF